MAEHGLWCKGLPCFKGAYHIPCVMRWPKGISEPGRDIQNFVGLEDFAPTFTELAGAESLGQLSGRSLIPFFNNQQNIEWRQEHYTQSNGNELYGIQRSVTNQHYKLVYNGFDYDELYDLKSDPNEMHNIIEQPSMKPVIKDLYQKLWRHAHEHDDQCINGYIMVGLAEHGPGVQFME
jgi:arylsulfatase A-like enzyme